MSMKKISSFVSKSIRIVLYLPSIISIINAFYGIIQENSIWEVGKRVNLGKEKKMEMDFNIFPINTSIKGSF